MCNFSRFARDAALAAVLVASATYGTPAEAQDQQQPVETVLPDLAPREVEIRGQLQISFPSLRRQPLVGFNPPPRVPEIPMARRPILESYVDAGARINRSEMEEPDPPGIDALSGAAPFRAEAEVGTGRYVTRLIRGTAAVDLGPHRRLDARVRYQGSEGHEVSGSSGAIKNPNDDFDGSISYTVETERFIAGGSVAGFVSSFTLFGIDNRDGGNVRTNPERDGRGASLQLSIASATTSAVDYRLAAGLEQTRFASDLFSGGSAISDPGTVRLEKRGSVEAELTIPLSRVSAYTSARASWAGLDSGTIAGDDVSDAEVGAGVMLHRSDRMRMSAGPRVLTAAFDAGVGGLTGTRRRLTYLSADVDLSFRAGEVLTVIATNRPFVRRNALADLFVTNPYLVSEPAMQPSVMSVDAEVGLLFSSGPFQFKASVEVDQSPNWSYVRSSTGSGTSTVSSGFFDIGYASGRVTSAGGELALSLPAEVQFSSALFVHDAELTDTNEQIPYHPQLTARAGLSWPFAARRGLLQVTGLFVGKRYVDLTQTTQVDPYVDVDVYARYDLKRNLGLVIRVQNLGPGDRELWAGYPESPVIVTGGVRILW